MDETQGIGTRMFDSVKNGIYGLGNSLSKWFGGDSTSGSTLSTGTASPAISTAPKVDVAKANSDHLTANGINPYGKIGVGDKTNLDEYSLNKLKLAEADKAGGMFGLSKGTIDTGVGLATLGKDLYGMFNAAKMTKAALRNLNTQTDIMNNNEARTAAEYNRINEQRVKNTAAYGGK